MKLRSGSGDGVFRADLLWEMNKSSERNLDVGILDEHQAARSEFGRGVVGQDMSHPHQRQGGDRSKQHRAEHLGAIMVKSSFAQNSSALMGGVSSLTSWMV